MRIWYNGAQWILNHIQKKGKTFVNKKILEKYFVKLSEIDPYFRKNYKQKIKNNKNGHKYIPRRIDVNFFDHDFIV